jgi:histidinol-phosphatase (PHP family)
MMAQTAQEQGLTGLAFTEHGEWYAEDPAYGYLDLEAYFADLEAVRAQFGDALDILAGIELGNPHDFPRQAGALLDRWNFDLVIGSVHWLGGQAGWERPAFARGIRETYHRYFDELIVMVEHADFDVLGHLDLVRRDSWALFGHTLELAPFEAKIRHALRRLVEAGRGIEINTSGLHKGLGKPLPDLQVLQWYRELGGEILVFGSDAHRPEHIAYGFDRARELARAAGFERLARFQRREVVRWISL